MKIYTTILLLTSAFSAGAESLSGRDVSRVLEIYPCEAARVLAWQRNGDTARIVRVECGKAESDGETQRTVRWLDASGKVLRERTVPVASAATKPGPDYFRETLRALAADDWAIQSASPDNSRSAFWQGAELSGLSRTEALIAAENLVQEQPHLERPADAARLAGILAHGAVPSLADQRTLDALMVARAAAWLAVAEARLREPINASWVPILFLAGWEEEAATRWKDIAAKRQLKTEPEQFWNAILGGLPTLDRFTVAARRENAGWALPLMMRDAGKDPRFFTPLGTVWQAVSEPSSRKRWHDYAPARAASGDPLAAKLIEHPAPSREPWQRVLDGYRPTSLDPPKFKQTVAKSGFWDDVKHRPPDEMPRAPTAFVTADELLEACAEAERPPPHRSTERAELSDKEIRDLGAAALAAAAVAPAEPSSEKASVALEPMPDLKTADETWDYFQKLKNGAGFPDSPEDAMRRAREIQSRQLEVAERFAKQFPDDPRRWETEVFRIGVRMQEKLAAGGPQADFTEERTFLDSVLRAPDATDEAKVQAELLGLQFHGFNPMEPHTLPPFQRRLTEFLEKHPQHPAAPQVAMMQVRLLDLPGAQGAELILSQMAALPNEQIASMARAEAGRRERFAELKKKPLALKTKAVDGFEIDATTLRGQVVLLDFWASWCGPCLAEAPAVVRIYAKLHARGFAIIGVSLDEDAATMAATAKKLGMSWPQIFDGQGWKNAVATQFGVRSIPSTWLFDKKGILRQTDLRGEELEGAIERLLEE